MHLLRKYLFILLDNPTRKDKAAGISFWVTAVGFILTLAFVGITGASGQTTHRLITIGLAIASTFFMFLTFWLLDTRWRERQAAGTDKKR